MGTTVIYEREEIVLNFEKFTLVKVETDKGTYQSSLRGHNHSHDKLKRTAQGIVQYVNTH